MGIHLHTYSIFILLFARLHIFIFRIPQFTHEEHDNLRNWYGHVVFEVTNHIHSALVIPHFTIRILHFTNTRCRLSICYVVAVPSCFSHAAINRSSYSTINQRTGLFRCFYRR